LTIASSRTNMYLATIIAAMWSSFKFNAIFKTLVTSFCPSSLL
jgi:hypothetical protein